MLDCCHIKTTKKYTTRPGPPYPANEKCCQNQIRYGNNGLLYISKKAKNGIWRWTKIIK